MFSRSCEYALQAVLHISLHATSSQAVGLKAISEDQGVPLHFLSKVLQQLVKSNILISIKGPGGGFSLKTPSDKLTLLKVVQAIDGTHIFDRCGIGLKMCSDNSPCPIHFKYAEIKSGIKEVLSHKTIAQLCQDVRTGESIVAFK
ncbi:MAG: Rrf2 family transcriptional regulator [Cyclobacteriaceae bacterium]|nr:Rrf2 family transcriptional regulator [Cyclobacteriaceae bacterium HetDA_MAG_MS6]